MKSDVITDAWNAIRQEARSEPGWHVRRIHAAASCEIFAGIRQPGSVPGLLVEVATDEVPAGLMPPKSRGFVVEPSVIEGGAFGRVRFALVLADRTYEAVFSVLCEDAARASAAASRPRIALREWLTRLHVWQEFMARYGPEGLSEAAVIGLFGELLAIRKILIPLCGASWAIQAWAGPMGEPNDFAFPGGFLEVKTTARQAAQLIDVANMDQLDDTRGLILLLHLRLLPSSQGETLPELIGTLRSILIQEEDVSLREQFEQRLVSAGFLDVQSSLYDRGYVLHASELYRVSGDFPRIRRSGMHDGIRSVAYTIEVAACSDYRVDTDMIRSLMKVVENV